MSVLFRVDGSTRIGAGHVMRCLALAQAWQDLGEHILFVMADVSSNLEIRLVLENFEFIKLATPLGGEEDALQTVALAQQNDVAWVILDGYQFSAEYQKIIKENGLSLLAIDDNGAADYYYADIILNQNLHAETSLYNNKSAYTKLLLGPRYVLLRREFLKWQIRKRIISEKVTRLLVTLGGGDLENNTLKVIKFLQAMDNIAELEVVVIVGADNPHSGSLSAAISKSKLRIKLMHDVSNMPELMAWADLAITSGGVTVLELAFMGLPAIVGIASQAELLAVNSLEKYGLFYNIGWLSELSSEQLMQAINIQNGDKRNQVSLIGKKTVDGKGCQRVIQEVQRARYEKNAS